MFCMNILLDGLINKGDVVAVAVSGGSDSMALIHRLRDLSTSYGFKVVALNVEHGIRGDESKEDSKFVKEYCQKNGIEFISYEVDCPAYAKENKLSIEQSARILRYDCFYKAILEGKCDKVATAHHLQDNAETVLLNALRGSGIKGLSGISQSVDGKIIRPMLYVNKSDICAYVKKHGILYRTDSTNLSSEYTRNFLRNEVMPLIKKAFPEAEKSLVRLSTLAKLDDDYLSSIALSSVEIGDGLASFSTNLHPAVSGRCTIVALKSLGVEKDWEKAHIDAVNSLNKLQNGASVNLLDGVVAVREYDKITLFKKSNYTQEPLPFACGEFDFCGGKITIEKLSPYNLDLKKGVYLDADKIPEGSVIRCAMPSDVFCKFGGGSKKLCDYFTDKKIPRRIRNSTPLIAKDNDVLAIANVGAGEKVKVEKTTKLVYGFSFNK